MSLLTEDIKVIEKKSTNSQDKKIISCPEMTLTYQPKNELAAICSNNTTLINPGEIFTLLGPPGNGKTSLLEGNAASQIASKHNLSGIDTFGFRFNSIGKKTLFCDTERPGDDCHKTYQNIYKRMGRPAHLLTEDGVKIKDLTYLVMAEVGEVPQLWKILEQHLSTEEYELVILDGVLDFCISMLDDKDAVRVVKRLRSLAVKYCCAIVVSIHPNKGTQNPAGHIGAFLIRWSRALLFVRTTTDKNVKELTLEFDHAKLSHASMGDFEPVYFTWDSEKGMMVTCGAPAPPTYKIKFLKQAVMELRMRGHSEIPSAVLKEHYGKLAGISIDSAKRHLGKAVADGLLISIGGSKSTRYLPATDWDLSNNSDSGQCAPYIYNGARPESQISNVDNPNITRINEHGYPNE